IAVFSGTTGKILADSGIQTSSGSIRAVNGSVTSPSYTFANSNNMGFYRANAGIIGIAFGGVQFSNWSASGLFSSTPGRYFIQENLTATNPTYSFVGDANTGMYRSAADTLALVTSGANALVINPAGEINQPLQPSFLASNNTTRPNVTGNGTSYTVPCEQLIYDNGNDFNTTTGTFTAPVAGRYAFFAQCLVANCTVATQIIVRIVTSDRNLSMSFNRPADSISITQSVSVVTPMDAGDTFNMQVQVSGEAADTCSVQASNTRMSGYLQS